MTISRILQLLTFARCVPAFAVGNEPQLNSTVETPGATAVEALPTSLVTSDSNGRPTWRPKVHGESTADGWETTTAGGVSTFRIEATATDFHVTTPTTEGRIFKSSITIIDIATVIESLITSLPVMPTVHFENSAPGWDDATSTVHFESSASGWVTPSSAVVHFEISASGWEKTQHQNPSTPQSTRYRPVEISEDSWTKDLQTPQINVPDEPKSDQPQVTTIPSRIVTDYTPPPAITHDGITARPIAVTRKSTVTMPDGGLTAIEEVEFQIAIGSSTLSIGNPITINNVVVGVTTDEAGSTVLHAGDMITTLPGPTAGEVRTVSSDAQERLSIMTAIVGGTTKYVLAGQTLAPGQPVTIGDTPISIATSDDKTVLYVGNKTTTLAAADSDMQTITDWASISTGTQETVAITGPMSAKPTSSRSGSSQSRIVDAALAHCAMAMAMFIVTA